MKDKYPITSVDLIVNRNNKILLGGVSDKWRGQNKYEWGLPGREIEFGDNFETIVKKNLKEELGVKLVNFKIICINNNFSFGNHYIVIGILVEAEGEPKIMKPEDWKQWRWFNKDEIPKKLFPSAELTIKSFLEKKKNVEGYCT